MSNYVHSQARYCLLITMNDSGTLTEVALHLRDSLAILQKLALVNINSTPVYVCIYNH